MGGKALGASGGGCVLLIAAPGRESDVRDAVAPLAELVDITNMLNRHGIVSDTELKKTTVRMLGADALAKPAALSSVEITHVRETAGVSQAVMAGYLNVAVSTVCQWERGQRRPTGTALKLLHIVKSRGLEVLR